MGARKRANHRALIYMRATLRDFPVTLGTVEDCARRVSATLRAHQLERPGREE